MFTFRITRKMRSRTSSFELISEMGKHTFCQHNFIRYKNEIVQEKFNFSGNKIEQEV